MTLEAIYYKLLHQFNQTLTWLFDDYQRLYWVLGAILVIYIIATVNASRQKG